jgi:hypothetical protein
MRIDHECGCERRDVRLGNPRANRLYTVSIFGGVQAATVLVDTALHASRELVRHHDQHVHHWLHIERPCRGILQPQKHDTHVLM